MDILKYSERSLRDLPSNKSQPQPWSSLLVRDLQHFSHRKLVQGKLNIFEMRATARAHDIASPFLTDMTR